MGTPTPPPPTSGSSCDICDDICWPAGSTPGNVHVEFKDLEKCPISPLDPPNGIWVLTQDDVNPCYWQYDDNEYKVIVELGPGQTEVGCVGMGVADGWTFFQGSRDECHSEFNNIIIVCGGRSGSRRGTATITWS